MKPFKRWGLRRRQFQSAEKNALQQPAAEWTCDIFCGMPGQDRDCCLFPAVRV